MKHLIAVLLMLTAVLRFAALKRENTARLG